MAVFPESMNRLDVSDTAGSLSKIDNYIRYMVERVEFAMRNMTRNVSDAGTSTVEILLLLDEFATALSVVSRTVNGMTGEITTVNNRITEVQTKQKALEDSQKALEDRQSALETTTTGLQASIAALEARVAALEGEIGG